MQDVTLPRYRCVKCGREWVPRTLNPKLCPNPNCRSPHWHYQTAISEMAEDHLIASLILRDIDTAKSLGLSWEAYEEAVREELRRRGGK